MIKVEIKENPQHFNEIEMEIKTEVDDPLDIGPISQDSNDKSNLSSDFEQFKEQTTYCHIPQELGKATTTPEDSYITNEKLNVSTLKPTDSNDSFIFFDFTKKNYSEKNRKQLSQSRVELKEELGKNGYILCTKSTCQMAFLSIKGN